ncbi:MAG: tandem-95 repeat protein [Gemmatimonadota bacterium]|nr:tandem-95 repeat protein [Gemmatimonadota bacterium]
MVALALFVFAIPGADPAQAQTSVRLTGNIGPGAGDDWHFGRPRAQAFTTGGNSAGRRGYKLTGVDLTLRRPTSTPANANPTYQIHIKTDDGTNCGTHSTSPASCPGATIVGTLTNPTVADLPGQLGTVRITAPGAGIDLAAGTTYWLMIEVSTGSTWWRVGTTRVTDETSDASVPAGWSIGRTSYGRFVPEGWREGNAGIDEPFEMALYGYEKTPPPPGPGRPSPPVVTTASETSLTVSWSAPSGGAAVTDYDLRYYAGTADPADPADWIEEGEPNGPPDPGTSTTATITGLSPGTPYRVQVRAASGGREGPWSASFATATVFPPPPPPPPDPAVSVEGGTATEGSPVTFTAWVSPPADADVVLGWSTGIDDDPRSRAATPGADYTPVTDGQVTIPAGERTASFSVETLPDAEKEPDETFTITIIGNVLPDDVTLEVRTAVGTIEDEYTPPEFAPSAYAFELPENTDGSGEPFGLGAVSATDPGGGDVSYALAAGDAERFAVGARDGAVSYTGTGEDFETEPNVYELTVRATDAGGLSDEALVTVEVVNVNEGPSFGSSEYAFELRENVDGSEAPVGLGSLSAADPDGDALTYELVSGDAERFAVGAGDGAVAYVGPGEDYESEPNLYELTVRASDSDGLSAEAQVTVEILDVNELPEAADDAASTVEDVAVTVDVLANDTDPDGDGLRVASVSAPENGTAAVAAGGVLYTPAANWHGTDRFTYTADDGKGGTAEASVEVTVTPVNDAPEAVGTIPAQSLDEGAEPARIELGPFFDDLDGDTLAYSTVSSDPSVVEAQVVGSVLTLVPVGYGSATVEVTAADAGGLTAMQTVSVGVTDHAAREAVSHTLAGLARSHLASARATLGRRASASRSEASQLTLLGRDVPLGADAAKSAAEQVWEGWLSGASSRAMSQATPRAGGSGGDASLGDLFRLGDLVRFTGGRDPLHGSEFQFVLGGPQEAGGGGLRFQLWGQGDVQTFQGAPSDASDYDGELQTGYVGVDTWLSDNWMLGVAVARSRGTGDWRTGGTGGSLETRLVAVHPYLQWSGGATSVWAMAGAGRGDADNVRDRGGRTETSGLGLRMGLVELRRRLAASGGFEFGLRTDAAWAELATDDGTETVDGQTAAVNQVRFGAELSQQLRLGGLTLAPFGEAHVRRDGGDGQPGTGLELIGGLRAQAGILRIDAQGRVLAVHSAAGYEERGLGLTLSLGKRGGEGPSLSLSPRWGDAIAGGNALWQEQVYSRYVPAAADGETGLNAREPWALDLSGGYGMRMPGDRLLTWSGSVNHSPAGPRFTLGAQLGFGASSGAETTAGAMAP